MMPGIALLPCSAHSEIKLLTLASTCWVNIILALLDIKLYNVRSYSRLSYLSAEFE